MGQGGVISPRSLSSGPAPIAQSLKGLFQRQPHPPATLPSGGLLPSRRNSSDAQTTALGVCRSQTTLHYISINSMSWSMVRVQTALLPHECLHTAAEHSYQCAFR